MAQYLVLETNRLAALTYNSIFRHDPDAVVKTVTPDDSFVGTALRYCNEQTIVLKSGVVWRGSQAEVPDIAYNYPICVSEWGVFTDHPRLDHSYGLVNMDVTRGNKDLSVFIINPRFWIKTPETDKGLLGKVKKLNMPRYMNHKDDPLVFDVIPPQQALFYGILGTSAVALNYVSTLLRGNVGVNETVAYLFDHIQPYSAGLDQGDVDAINILADKTRSRVGKLRDGLAEINGVSYGFAKRSN